MDKWTTHDQLEYRIEEIVQRLFDLTLAMIYDHQSEVEAKKIMTIMVTLLIMLNILIVTIVTTTILIFVTASILTIIDTIKLS